MGRRIVLGCGVGAVVALSSWARNRTPHLVSTFPDAVPLVVLLLLLSLAIAFDHQRQISKDRSASWLGSMTIAAATGIVFGLGDAALAASRFGVSSAALAVFGFITAFSSSLLCAAPAVAWTLRRGRHTRGAA